MDRAKIRPKVRYTGMGLVVGTGIGLMYIIFIAQDAETWQLVTAGALHLGGWFAFAPSVADKILDAWEHIGPTGGDG